jgi:myo-inositol-1(or 4)-monophosphatase
VRPELAAAHAAVDEAVKILRDGRARPQKRIGKAAKDFLTELDLASESAMQRSLADSTPKIGFYGEEDGGRLLSRAECGSRIRSTGRSTTRPGRRCAG